MHRLTFSQLQNGNIIEKRAACIVHYTVFKFDFNDTESWNDVGINRSRSNIKS